MDHELLGQGLVLEVSADLLNTLAVLAGKSDADAVDLRGFLDFDLLYIPSGWGYEVRLVRNQRKSLSHNGEQR